MIHYAPRPDTSGKVYKFDRKTYLFKNVMLPRTFKSSVHGTIVKRL